MHGAKAFIAVGIALLFWPTLTHGRSSEKPDCPEVGYAELEGIPCEKDRSDTECPDPYEGLTAEEAAIAREMAAQVQEQGDVLSAYSASPEVAGRLAEMESDGWTPGNRNAILLGESCGFAGCNRTYLALRYFTKTPGQANPQTISVQARVVINRQSGKVLSVELISAE